MTRPKQPKVSARKAQVSANSPHPVHTEGAFSPQPQPQKKSKKPLYGLYFERAGNYAGTFKYVSAKFWEKAAALSRIAKAKVAKPKDKLSLGRNVLKKVPLSPVPLSDIFVSVFVDAVRDPNFLKLKRLKGRARFLGDSLGADGTVSARRSRDICGKERAMRKRKKPARLPRNIEFNQPWLSRR